MADILSKVIHLYSTEGLTCYCRIRVRFKLIILLFLKLKTFSKHIFLLPGQYFQAIQACNWKVMWFKSVRWHDDGSLGHKLRYAPPSLYHDDPSSCRITCINRLYHKVKLYLDHSAVYSLKPYTTYLV